MADNEQQPASTAAERRRDGQGNSGDDDKLDAEVPRAPAGPQDPPADPAEPMNPA